MKILKHYPKPTVVLEKLDEYVVIDGRMWTVKDVKEMIIDSLISTKQAYLDLLKSIKEGK